MSTCSENAVALPAENDTPAVSAAAALEAKTELVTPVKATNMSLQYTIDFRNNHGGAANYILFYGPPTNDDPADPQVLTYVWISEFIPNQGNLRVIFTTDEYGWCGEVNTTVSNGTVIRAIVSNSKEVTLGTASEPGSTLNMVIQDSVPLLEDGNKPLGQNGSFAVETGTDFTLPNETYMIGTGYRNIDQDQVIPTAAWFANNNITTQITPSQKIYLASSKLPVGAQVNVDTIAQHAAVIDYSVWPSQGYKTAVIEQESNGAYNITYRST
ncbi:hypothetical protein TWF694_004258 [Orbilia ellipsospora]|uniref:Uncharacterized protein n=1 Tax=Orbilia ellipsospora TaxID=2528407 RepID=A0AAV9WYG1_9PEZI